MADAKFQIAENGVLKDPIHRACRAAVVYPLAGRGRAYSEEELQTVYDKLYQKWRLRVVRLRNAGWNFFSHAKEPGKTLTFTRNCPPVAVRTTSDKRYYCCKRAKICPHCYARQVVVQACLAFEVLLPSLSEQSRSGMSLLAFQRTMQRPVSQWPIDHLIRGLKASKVHTVEIDTITPRPVGSVVFTNVSLNDAGDQWILRRSGVVLVDSQDADIDFSGVGTDDEYSIRKKPVFNLDNACAMVGWAAKYPTTWMRAPIQESVEMLNAMESAKFRQIRFHGILRNGFARKKKSQEIAKKRLSHQIQN